MVDYREPLINSTTPRKERTSHHPSTEDPSVPNSNRRNPSLSKISKKITIRRATMSMVTSSRTPTVRPTTMRTVKPSRETRGLRTTVRRTTARMMLRPITE